MTTIAAVDNNKNSGILVLVDIVNVSILVNCLVIIKNRLKCSEN